MTRSSQDTANLGPGFAIGHSYFCTGPIRRRGRDLLVRPRYPNRDCPPAPGVLVRRTAQGKKLGGPAPSPSMSAAPLIPIENVYLPILLRVEPVRGSTIHSPRSSSEPGPTEPLGTRTLDRYWRAAPAWPRSGVRVARGGDCDRPRRIRPCSTLRLFAQNKRRLHCEFDELSHDVTYNRILKASLKRLSQAPTLAPELAQSLRALASRFSGVSEIKLERSSFSRSDSTGTTPIMTCF